MRLFTSVVSFNRLELLKRTLDSYFETVTLPFELIIVDNASDEETRSWLEASELRVVYLPENRYPGYATNKGWKFSDESHDILHRSDNDVHYLPGWCEAVVNRFERGHGRGGVGLKVGQVGLMTDSQEGRGMPAVGGNMVMRRELFKEGVRYGEDGWDVQPWEDGAMTRSVINSGWGWARVATQCLVHLGDPPDFNDPYYRTTYEIRGILPEGV
jgi:glycosyltransferase involved in cell wall biosynthesis